MADLKAFDRLGNRITVPEDKVAELEKLGGRVATPEELREHKIERDYENASTVSKVSGLVTGIGARPPQLEAWTNATSETLTAGLQQAAIRKGVEIAVDTLGRGEKSGKKAGDQYADRVDDLARMYPGTTTAGKVAGVIGGVAIGAAGGASAGGGIARALPMNAVSALGAPVEHGVARGLAGVAARGAGGRALSTGLSLGARAAVEGGAYAGIEEAARQVRHDEPIDGEKLYTAIGHGALAGGGIGFGLGAGGSLAASGARYVYGRGVTWLADKLAGFAAKGEAEAAASAARGAADEAGLGLSPTRRGGLGGETSPRELRGSRALGRLEDWEINAPQDPRRLGGMPLLGEGEGLYPKDGLAPRVSVSGKGVSEGPYAPRAPRPTVDEMLGEVVPPKPGPAPEPPPSPKVPKGPPAVDAPGHAPNVESPPPAPPPPAAATPETFAARAERHARQVANDLAWDSLGTTRKISDKVNGRVDGGTRAVGDYILRRVTRSNDATTGWTDILNKSRADELLPIIEAELAADGRRIGEEVAAHNVRVDIDDVFEPARELAREMSHDPTRIQGVKAFQDRVTSMFEAFGNARQIAGDQTMSLSDLYYARAKMEGVAHELNRGSAAHDAFKTYLRRIDDMLVDKLDDAAKAAGGEGSSRIRELKREYQLGSWAKRAAEDGAKRLSGNNIFGLREGIGAAVGLATGHTLTGVGAVVAGKVIRERGAAIGAHILSQAAERGVIAKAVKAVDEKVRSAAANVLREGKRIRAEQPKPRGRPKKSEPISGREQQKATIKEGQEIVRWVAKVQSDPTAYRKSIEDAASVIADSAGPKTADAWTTTALRAFNFVAQRIPQKQRLDPLDASSTPPLTFEEADRLVTATKYATQPMSVWDDLENGIVTPDAVDAAKTFMPEAWQEFQMHLYGHLEEQVSRNVQLSQSQRLRVYRILGIPAGADMRPEIIKRYQANFTQQQVPSKAPPAKPSGSKPIDLKINQSAFDRAEARAAG